MTLTVGSLFSGIGGIDLGLERAGMTVKWQSEIDPYACKVLKKHWPDTPNLGDIKQIDWSTVEHVDVIAGGYPCQPFSTAGKRLGENDPRHLWPYFRDAISGIRPRFAILENVRGHLSMGFDRVLADLTEIGYDAEWQIVSAASVGAPHRRERIICVAYPQGDWQRRGHSENTGTVSKRVAIQTTFGGSSSVVANPDGNNPTYGGQRKGLQGKNQRRGNDGSGSGSDTGQIGLGGTRQDSCDVAHTNSRQISGRFGGEPAHRGHLSGRSDYLGGEKGYAGGQWWAIEPDVGRVAYGVPARVDRLRGLGNAVVPQVAEYVGRLITQSLT